MSFKWKLFDRGGIGLQEATRKSQEELKQRALDEAREAAFGRGMTEEELKAALGVPYENALLRAVVSVIRGEVDVAAAHARAKPMDEDVHAYTAQQAALVALEERLLGMRDAAVEAQAQQENGTEGR